MNNLQAPQSGKQPPQKDMRSSAGARGNWAWRDRPGIFWLIVAAIVAFAHPAIPASRWLLVHALLLGAVTHSLMVWSRHFVITLLKLPADDRKQQELRLKLLHAGVLVVVVGVVGGWLPVTIVGATLVVAAVLWHAYALIVAMKRALPSGWFRSRDPRSAGVCSYDHQPLGLGGHLRDWHGQHTVAHDAAHPPGGWH